MSGAEAAPKGEARFAVCPGQLVASDPKDPVVIWKALASQLEKYLGQQVGAEKKAVLTEAGRYRVCARSSQDHD